MAQAKVTIESLTQMAEILRQSADDILGTKEQMDNELYNIPWDDPIGLTFISKYEEDFKPLKEKLIPNINNYIQYMKDEGLVVSEYSGESIGGLGVIGAAGAGAAGAGAKGKGVTSNGIKDSHDKQINTDSVIPTEEEFNETLELQPYEQIVLNDGTVIEITPIPNGCGTTKGIGHWAGQTGAGVDAFMNLSPVATGVALVGIVTGVTTGPARIIAIAEAGKILNPKEFQRLNDEACAMHDICYVQGDKFVCEKNLYNDGGRFMSIGTSLFGGPAYKEAQREGLNSQMYLKKSEIMKGKRIILPEGYWARMISTGKTENQ